MKHPFVGAFLFGGSEIKFHEKISEQQKKRLETLKTKNEKLSLNDLAELMGLKRDTFKRNRVAIRRKERGKT